MLNVAGGIEAFENTLRTYMNDKIINYNLKASDLMQGAVGAFENSFGYFPINEPLTFEGHVTNFNDPTLTQAYQNTISFVSPATGKIDEATRLSRRKFALTQMAEALGTTYELLLKMGDY